LNALHYGDALYAKTDIYLRKVEGKENKVVGVAVKGLADPGRGCRM
jgi:hypothetical protein